MLSLAHLVQMMDKTKLLMVTPPMNHQNRSFSLTRAVNTLRCFIKPGCYPNIRCANKDKEPMAVSVKRGWEAHGFCTSDLLTSKGEHLPDQKCLVYSFGIHTNTDWEVNVATLFGCDVYAFDPTSDLPQIISPGVTFHRLGLQGEGSDVSRTHSDLYDSINATRLRTLGQIVRFLGHEGRQIDILRLDCEGCEYGVLKEMCQNGHSRWVKQLMIEFHFQQNLGLLNEADVLLAADAISCLEEEQWGIVSMEKRGSSTEDAKYADAVLRFLTDPFLLLFVTLRRVPLAENQSWKLYGEVVQSKVNVKYFELQHGLSSGRIKKDDLSAENRAEYLLKREKVGEATRKYNAMYRKRDAYDKHLQVFPGKARP